MADNRNSSLHIGRQCHIHHQGPAHPGLWADHHDNAEARIVECHGCHGRGVQEMQNHARPQARPYASTSGQRGRIEH